jgi:hypothetical protein
MKLKMHYLAYLAFRSSRKHLLYNTNTLFIILAFTFQMKATYAGYQEGLDALKIQDYITAVKEFQNAAENGDPKSQTELGKLYFTGRGIGNDKQVAFFWFTKAADQGNSESQLNLAKMYESGRHTTEDKPLAAQLYQKASDQGNSTAAYNLSHMYKDGVGVQKNEKKGYALLVKSATAGNADAQCELGKSFDSKKGGAKQAAIWYQKAVEQNHPGALFALGILYKSGKGFAKNLKLASDLIERSAELGFQDARDQAPLYQEYSKKSNEQLQAKAPEGPCFKSADERRRAENRERLEDLDFYSKLRKAAYESEHPESKLANRPNCKNYLAN